MLTTEEIESIMQEDRTSDKKKFARQGQKYYDGDHDIKKYRLFYYNSDGNLVEDKTRSNIKIPHPFFTELVDQAVQYILSGKDGFAKSDDPLLQKYLDEYFNQNEDFTSELSDLLTGCMSKGFEYMYAYKNEEDKLSFMCADSCGVIEVRDKDTDEKCSYVIYWYIDRIDKGKKAIKRIQAWNSEEVGFFVQENEGAVQIDDSEPVNPRKHILYKKADDNSIYCKSFGYIPFFRLDNNKKQFSCLKTVKDLIDDYDLMASSLSNNLVDFDTPIHVVKGFQGDNLEELQQNLKTKKMIGVDDDGDVDVKTIDVPYEARQAKLDLDEKNIYRFGMGLNTAGLKDTTATTNIAIKAAYSLLDLKCCKLEIKLKQFLRKILKLVLDEINSMDGTDYRSNQVRFEFKHEIMSNEQENAQNKLTEAQTQQTLINTLLSLAARLDNETLMKNICDVLDIDYEKIKDLLPDPDEAESDLKRTQDILNGVKTDEPGTEGSTTDVS